MHPAINDYLEDVFTSAKLDKKDRLEVAEELLSHMDILNLDLTVSHKEARRMIEDNFGKAQDLGKSISKAKWKASRFFSKQLKCVASAFLIACVLKWQVLGAYTVKNSSMEPLIPNQAYVLVNKMAYLYDEPALGDLTVYNNDGQSHVVQIVSVEEKEKYFITKKNLKSSDKDYPKVVTKSELEGRIFLATPSTQIEVKSLE